MNLLTKILLAAAMLLTSQVSLGDIETTGSGTVAETIDVGDYVYLRLAENGNWLAAAPTEIAIGDKINYAGGALMKDFHSRKLDQTFDEILFVMTLYVTEQAPDDAANLVEHAHQAASASNLSPPAPGEIKPLEGGMTVAEVYSAYRQLQGKEILVRARVMKFSQNIMGTNWATLQDGSGTAPDNKLVVKTDQILNVGDEITAKGKVATDVSLGTGYDYKVLLEEASFLQ